MGVTATAAPGGELSAYDDPDFQALAYRYHALLTNWRGQARVVIKRRAHLMRLGLVDASTSSGEEWAQSRNCIHC